MINLDQNTVCCETTASDHAVIVCRKCDHSKPIIQFYTKGGRRPTMCKVCELGAKAKRRQQKKKQLGKLKRRRASANAKTLDIAAFQVIETCETHEDHDLQEIAEQYIDKIVSGTTKLRESI